MTEEQEIRAKALEIAVQIVVAEARIQADAKELASELISENILMRATELAIDRIVPILKA